MAKAEEGAELHKVSVTYVAPQGDAKVTEMFGQTYFDGQAKEVELDEHAYNKLSNNRCFKVAQGGSTGKADAAKGQSDKHEPAKSKR